MQTFVRSSRIDQRSLVVDLLLAAAIGLLGASPNGISFSTWAFPAMPESVGSPSCSRAGDQSPLGHGHVTGVSMGLLGGPLGLSHSPGYNVLLCGMAGSLLDSGTVLRLPLQRAWGAVLAGAVAHLAKFGFVFVNAWISAAEKRVETYVIVAALANHLMFGIAGGLLGWVLWRGGRAALTRCRVPNAS